MVCWLDGYVVCLLDGWLDGYVVCLLDGWLDGYVVCWGMLFVG